MSVIEHPGKSGFDFVVVTGKYWNLYPLGLEISGLPEEGRHIWLRCPSVRELQLLEEMKGKGGTVTDQVEGIFPDPSQYHLDTEFFPMIIFQVFTRESQKSPQVLAFWYKIIIIRK